MKNMHYWSKEEIKYLRSHYMDCTLSDMALQLGISVPTVSKKCKALGLVRPPRVSNARVWSESELEYLREHWPDETASDISSVIGVSDVCVRRKAIELGLKKSESYSSRNFYGRYVRNYKHNRVAV